MSKGRRAARETDEFLRAKTGAEAPAVVALSLLSSAANAFAPLVMVRTAACMDTSMCVGFVAI